MRKLLIICVMLNIGLLFAIGQQLSHVAEMKSGASVGSDNDADATQNRVRTNTTSAIDLSGILGVSSFLSGSEAPRVCLANNDLEARLSAAESEVANLRNQHPVDWSALENVPASFTDGVDNDTSPPVIAGFTFVETNAQGYSEYTQNTSGIRFVKLSGGAFDMGSPESEAGRGTDESPVHTVSLSPFLIAKYEVTQNEYKTVMQMPPPGVNDDPSSVKGDDLPVESVSWNDLLVADGFLERTGLSLPNEAQWEYAARAGTPEPYSGTASVDDMGWYDDNSDDEPHEVGTKQPNQFGLHDMHGNVYEWCEDVYKEAYYSDEVPGFDPVSTSGTTSRVIRGGSFFCPAEDCRSASRELDEPDLSTETLGFRPIRRLP